MTIIRTWTKWEAPMLMVLLLNFHTMGRCAMEKKQGRNRRIVARRRVTYSKSEVSNSFNPRVHIEIRNNNFKILVKLSRIHTPRY